MLNSEFYLIFTSLNTLLSEMFELNIPDYFVKCSPAPTPQALLYLMQSFTYSSRSWNYSVRVYVFLFTIFLSTLECERHESRFHDES